jgi:hypothetical protein
MREAPEKLLGEGGTGIEMDNALSVPFYLENVEHALT